MRFPDIPLFQGINAPSRVEADLVALEIIEEFPREIDSAFYRERSPLTSGMTS